ncbi:transglycosylase SLT domain-containing protein [Acidiphilium multivorum]|uniref:transglycosylase SLT domain-containing protein n=1 Tax=Acidiphilium multivorum TaxID=62140 RepID=UPI0039C96AFB
MAVKSIIDIDVQDEAFKRFLDLFDEFQSKIADLPDEWKKVDAAMGGAGKTFAKTSGASDAILAGMAASSATIVEAIHKATKAQREFEHATRRSHTALDGVAKTASKVSHSIFGIGKWMLKWGTLGGGLAGIAGGVGLDDLANSALSRQRSARGIGMTPGQQAAFQTYFGQFGATQGVESGIANARNDVSKRWIFSGLGITSQDLATKSNFALAIEAERRAQQIVKAAPRGEWENIAQARGLTQAGFTMEQLRVLRHTSAASLNRAAAGAAGSVNALGFTPGVAREWTQFSIALRRAGVEIESSLITGLHRLTPELSAVSQQVSNWIAAFLRGGNFQRIIGNFEDGIKDVAAFVSSPKFKTDLETFGTDIAIVARKVVEALQYLKIIPGAQISYNAVAKAAAVPNQKIGLLGRAALWEENNGFGYNAHDARLAMAGATQKYKIPKGMLWRLSGVESSHGENLLGPKTKYGRAEGWMQLLPATASALHVNPWSMNPRRSGNAAMGAAHYLRILHDHFGSWDKAVAAYNWGPGNLDADIKAHGRDWLKYAPAQTQHEVAAVSEGPGLTKSVNRLMKTLRKQQAHKPATVVIRNQTSARVALQANGAAY